MVWCVAVGCTNYKSKNKELTFFCLPKDKKLAEEWKAKVKRENLPKLVFLCEQHFADSCFDKSVDLRNQLLTGK